MLDLDEVPPNVRARVERSLVEAERTLAVAETEFHTHPPGLGIVFMPVRRSVRIAVPTVLAVVAGAVEMLIEDARTYAWSATDLRTHVERIMERVSRHVFEAFRVRETPFESFRLEVLRDARTCAWWAAYQAVLEERSSALATFSAQLRALVAEARMKPADLVSETGFDRKTVYNHLNGRRPPVPGNLETYERVFSARLKRAVTLTY